MRLPILQLSFRLFFLAKHHVAHMCQPSLQPRFDSLRLLAFPKAKIVVESGEICEYDVHTIHNLSQRRLTAEWLAPRESDCSRLRSKVSSDWLPSYTEATRPVLEIFKMAGYFPDSPRITHTQILKEPRACYPVSFLLCAYLKPDLTALFIYINLLLQVHFGDRYKFYCEHSFTYTHYMFRQILPSLDETFVILIQYSAVTVTFVNDPNGCAV